MNETPSSFGRFVRRRSARDALWVGQPPKPVESLLVEAVRRTGDFKMPPDKPLKPNEAAAIARWVEAGLPWPDAGAMETGNGEASKSHWSFQSVIRSAPPEVRATDWPLTDIDRFVLSRLETRQLQPAPKANSVMLIRRATFDLIGLPPTPEEVLAFEEAFRHDEKAAWRALLDRLLQSPHWG